VGRPADLLLVDTDVVDMTPGDLVDDLVYAASGSVVDSTVIAGEVVMRHRAVPGEDEARAQAREHAARMRDAPQ
jgi:5-methylthioadenosine/S-adenosylhomocysteine deaminase